MSDSASPSTVAELLDSFTHATSDRLDEEFLRLAGALWRDGDLTEHAEPATPTLIARVEQVDDDRKGYLITLLGLLAEAEYPATGGPVTTAVRGGLDGYLNLLSRCGNGDPLTFALLYLLSHLPEDRDRILAAAEGLALEPDDQTRLDRCLAALDTGDVVLGRVWPSPWAWSLNDSQREFDQEWIKGLSPEQITATWHSDTRTILAYSGAKALWAVRNAATPTAVTDTSQHSDPQPSTPDDLTSDVYAEHEAALRCPTCHGALDFQPAAASCATCAVDYPIAHGVLDFLAVGGETDSKDDVLQNATKMQGIGYYYEAVLRPAFLRVMASNWGGLVAPTDEDSYLAAHLSEVDGPVLDLAAGAGRWTAVVAETVGTEQVIALDVITPMLVGLRGRLPKLSVVRGSALSLPFADASLGAVNCWNALQAFPDPEQAVAEVGRCLRPGGVLTLLTMRWGSDRIYRYFQHSHVFPGSPEGLELFEVDEVKAWLDAAGLAIRHESGPGTFVFITAERTG